MFLFSILKIHHWYFFRSCIHCLYFRKLKKHKHLESGELKLLFIISIIARFSQQDLCSTVLWKSLIFFKMIEICEICKIFNFTLLLLSLSKVKILHVSTDFCFIKNYLKCLSLKFYFPPCPHSQYTKFKILKVLYFWILLVTLL